jgi:hypothetical protein
MKEENNMTANYELHSLCENIAQFLVQRFPESNIAVSSVTNPKAKTSTPDEWKIKVYYRNKNGVDGVCFFSESDNIRDVLYKLEYFINVDQHSKGA